MVGMPDTAVRESRERIKSALINSGFGYPNKGVTINLAPANVRKEGAGFDLPMALGILGAMGSRRSADKFLCAGNSRSTAVSGLSADASRRGLRAEARNRESDRAGRECGRGCCRRRCSGLRAGALVGSCRAGEWSDAVSSRRMRRNRLAAGISTRPIDFADVKGQTTAKRALEVAAAGAHNVLNDRPARVRQDDAAKRFAGILPALTFDEALETTKIHSVAGVLPKGTGLLWERPFRAPHHSVSRCRV